MGRPVSQHLGGAAVAAAAAVDVLTVATAAVGLPPMDDGAVDDGGGWVDAEPPVEDGDEARLPDAEVDVGGCGGGECGETDDDWCRRFADESCNGGGLDEDDEDVCGGGGNSDVGGANAV